MHWTYDQPKGIQLQQGDILRRTDALLAALNEAHGWFAQEKYSAFLVLSQSCDLAIRDGAACKTPYITIAPVRPLRDMLPKILFSQTSLKYIIQGWFPSKDRARMEDIIRRIINQNDSGFGLFYLHPEHEVRISEESVALLRLGVGLRADIHYDTLVQARTGSLLPEFQSKLGWMCGNLFSRVGVTDWTESDDRAKIASELISSLVSDGRSQSGFIESEELIKKLRSGEISPPPGASPEQIEQFVCSQSGRPYRDVFESEVKQVLESLQLSSGDVDKILGRLRNTPGVTRCIKKGSE